MTAARRDKLRKADLQKAKKELDSIGNSLEMAYLMFDQTSDPALMDACIYEINALRTRYDHAIKSIKSLFL